MGAGDVFRDGREVGEVGKMVVNFQGTVVKKETVRR